MKLNNQKEGTILTILDVPENIPCENCNSCLRIKLMEMGFLPGVKVRIDKHHQGNWILSTLSDNNLPEQRIALRDEEAGRIFFEDSECSFITSEN